MAEYPPVCRVCLAINVNLLTIADTPLQFVYERLTGTLLHDVNMKPLTACYICYALLRKSYKLMLTSLTAENLLNEIAKRNSKITKRSVYLVDRKANDLCGSLVTSPPECIDSTPRVPATTNSAQHPPSLPPLPVEGAPGNAGVTPGHAIKVEEQDVKNECEIELDDLSSPQAIEMLDEDLLDADDNREIVSETQQAVNSSEDSLDEPDMTAEHRDEETNAAVANLVRSQKTLCLSVPRLPGEKLYECIVCHRQFKYSNVYKNHLRAHTGEKPYACHICERKFSISHNLKSHLKTHTSDKPHECTLCGKQFRRQDHLKRHVESHADEKPHQCIVCNRRFGRKYHLQRHSSVHTGEKRFECNVCEWRFNNAHNLEKHLRTHTDAASALHQNPTIEELEENSITNSPLDDQLDTRTHMELFGVQSHSRNSEISVESKSFNRKIVDSQDTITCNGKPVKIHELKQKAINTNIKGKKQKPKKFKCDLCDHTFRCNSRLKIHLRIHNGVRPYECTVCHKAFHTITNLKKHLKTHNKEKLHECEFCQRKFSRYDHMTRHRTIHTVGKTYECKICTRRFNLPHQLRTHMGIHSNALPFECDICTRRFRLRNNLISHLKKIHP